MGFAIQVPELVVACETAVNLLRSGVAPTAAQQAQIDAALEAANAGTAGIVADNAVRAGWAKPGTRPAAPAHAGTVLSPG